MPLYGGVIQPWFQSSSGQKAGCNAAQLRGRSWSSFPTRVSILIRPEGRMQSDGWQDRALPIELTGFNPHPARRPDAIWKARPARAYSPNVVSILIRPEGRMQFDGSAACGLIRDILFQSSSGQKAGCNVRGGVGVRTRGAKFQSSSGQKAGCNTSRGDGRRQSAVVGFNPHPARRPDAIRASGGAIPRPPAAKFQSSSGQKAGCNSADLGAD